MVGGREERQLDPVLGPEVRRVGSATMRAAVLDGNGAVAIVEVPTPQPQPGEVRIRVVGCGVCGSDLPVWEGRPWFDYPRPPGAPGHEAWGWVDALGPGVSGLRVGERVAALSFNGYAEFDLAGGDRVVALPPVLAEQPFPGEALACAVNVVRRSQICAGAVVAVVGVGFLGAVICQLAARAGARVIALARRPAARELARRMGATDALDVGGDAPEQVARLTDGQLCDVVVEAAGAQATLDLAARLTRVRGRLVIAGYHQDGRREVDMQLWNWRGLDVINAHERDPAVYREGLEAAVAAAAAGDLQPRALYTHRFELERLADAFAAASGRGGERAVKAIVCP